MLDIKSIFKKNSLENTVNTVEGAQEEIKKSLSELIEHESQIIKLKGEILERLINSFDFDISNNLSNIKPPELAEIMSWSIVAFTGQMMMKIITSFDMIPKRTLLLEEIFNLIRKNVEESMTLYYKDTEVVSNKIRNDNIVKDEYKVNRPKEKNEVENFLIEKNKSN